MVFPLITPSSEDRTGISLELLMAYNYKVRKGGASKDEMLNTNGCPSAYLGLSISPSAHFEQWWGML
jgi:hypothetical protein